MREGGVQVLRDGVNNLNMTIEWLKVPGGAFGGSWVARIKGTPLDASMHSVISGACDSQLTFDA